MKKLSQTTTYQAGVIQSTMTRQIKKFTDECLKEYGITTMQWFVIGTIYDAGSTGIRIGALSKLVDTNIPYITNTINLLESRDIVVREEAVGDNRARVVKIHPSFAPKCPVIEQSLRKKMREGIYSHIEPHELQTYLKVIEELSKL